MWWEIFLGLFVALLLTLAFYVLAKAFFTQGFKNESQAGWLLLFAIGAILLSFLLVTFTFGLETILRKFAGFILLAFGFFMLARFPTSTDYQPEGFFWLGVVIGLFSTFLGIYWLLF